MLSYSEFVEVSKDVQELYLYIVNNDYVYAKRANSVINEIKRKTDNGVYNKQQSIKSLLEVVDFAVREIRKTNKIDYSKEVKKQVAKKLEQYYMSMIY